MSAPASRTQNGPSAGPRARLTAAHKPIAEILLTLVLAGLAMGRLDAWSAQGHRLVALVADAYLTTTARENVIWLLGNGSLADVAAWADEYVADHRQTSPWHYVNIPPDATRYDRNRDCPAPAARRATSDGAPRNCVVDRILFFRRQ